MIGEAAAEERRGNGHQPGNDVKHPTLKGNKYQCVYLTWVNTCDFFFLFFFSFSPDAKCLSCFIFQFQSTVFSFSEPRSLFLRGKICLLISIYRFLFARCAQRDSLSTMEFLCKALPLSHRQLVKIVQSKFPQNSMKKELNI